MNQPGAVQRIDTYPVVVTTTYRDALGEDPADPEVFRRLAATDDQTIHWYAPMDPRDGGSIMIHIRKRNLPSPVAHFDEIIVRMPELLQCRTFFLRHARASPTRRTSHRTGRCSMCSSCWFGYFVDDHSMNSCPIMKLPREVRRKFYFINTLAFCPRCGARSARHDSCTFTNPCRACNSTEHQLQMAVCDLRLEPAELLELIDSTRRSHYTKCAELGEAGRLRFFILNDYPDMNLLRERRPRGVYYGVGPYNDEEGEFPPIVTYQSAHRYRGIQHGETNPENFLVAYEITNSAEATAWEMRFRAENRRRIGVRVAQQQAVAIQENRDVPVEAPQNVPNRVHQQPEIPPVEPPVENAEVPAAVVEEAPVDNAEVPVVVVEELPAVNHDLPATEQDGQVDSIRTAASYSNLRTSDVVTVGGPEEIGHVDPEDGVPANRAESEDSTRAVRAMRNVIAYEWEPEPQHVDFMSCIGTMDAEYLLRTFITNNLAGMNGRVIGARVSCPTKMLNVILKIPTPGGRAELIERIRTYQELLTTRNDFARAAFEEYSWEDLDDYLKALEEYGSMWCDNNVIYGFQLIGSSAVALKTCIEKEEIKPIPTISVYNNGGRAVMAAWTPRPHERLNVHVQPQFARTWYLDPKNDGPARTPDKELEVELVNRGLINRTTKRAKEANPAQGSIAIGSTATNHAPATLKEILTLTEPVFMEPLLHRIATIEEHLVGARYGIDPDHFTDWESLRPRYEVFREYLAFLKGAVRVVLTVREMNRSVQVIVTSNGFDLENLTRAATILVLPTVELFQSMSIYFWATLTEHGWNHLIATKKEEPEH